MSTRPNYSYQIIKNVSNNALKVVLPITTLTDSKKSTGPSIQPDMEKSIKILNLRSTPIIEALNELKIDQSNITLNDILSLRSLHQKISPKAQELKAGEKYKLINRLQTMTFDEILHDKDPAINKITLGELLETY